MRFSVFRSGAHRDRSDWQGGSLGSSNSSVHDDAESKRDFWHESETHALQSSLQMLGKDASGKHERVHEEIINPGNGLFLGRRGLQEVFQFGHEFPGSI